MFGTSQNRLTCEFLVRMGSGGEPEGQGASESIFSENPRLRHPNTIKYLLRRCVSPQTCL